MSRALLLLALILCACATVPERKTLPDSAVATFPATEDQIFLAKRRAEAAASRLTPEENKALAKVGFLAVKTLAPSPEQVASLGPSGGGASAIMLWDLRASKLDGDTFYAVIMPPRAGKDARFGQKIARYMGSY